MTDALILEKLDTLEKQSNKLDKKVDKIETAVGLIAIQSERINNMQRQLQSLWTKYDEACGTEGTLSKIKQFQAKCPKDSIKNSITRLWWAIGLVATTVTGCLIKIINQLGGS